MSAAISVTATARALGLTVGRSGSQFWISPCPACGAERRHTKQADRRGPIGVKPNDEMWRCWQCDESGNAAWLARRAGQPLPERAAPPAAIPALDFLEPAEARRFWHRCAHARARPSVAAWLDGLRLGQAFCARALPLTARQFGWAANWEATGHHLVLGLHDHEGRLRNYLARAVVPAEKKSLAAYGVRRAGLVLADQLGVDLLRGRYDGPCVVVEGEKKLLISEHLAAGRWATIGTGSGMWSDGVALAVSRASRVLVSTDPDEPGVRYARRVVASVPGCVVRPELRALLGGVAFGSAEADDSVWEASGLPWYSCAALDVPTSRLAEHARTNAGGCLENTAKNGRQAVSSQATHKNGGFRAE